MNWKNVPLHEVAEIVTGKTPKTSDESNFGGEIPFVTPSELDSNEPIVETPRTVTEKGAKTLTIVPKGSVLVCCIASLGKIGIAGKSVTTNQQINTVVFDQKKVDPKYGFYACKRLKSAMINMAPSTTVPIISKSKFQELEIPLPPLNYQKRIAAILDQADAMRQSRRRAITRLNDLSQSIFYEMFGDPDQNPFDFPVEDLGVICDVRDGTHDSPKYIEDGYPLLTSKNFSSGTISFEGAKNISEEDFIKINKRSKVDIGDIVMPMIGTIGTPVIIKDEPNFAIKNVALFKFKERKITADYIHAILSSPFLERNAVKTSRGGTQKFIALGDIRSLKIPVPPEPLQVQFSQRLSALNSSKEQLEKSLKNIENLFLSLQQRAFRGEL